MNITFTTTTHTPGPWTVGDEDSPLLLSGDGTYVAQVISRDETGALRPSHAADAALIAAAPDLLAALQMIEEVASGRVPLVNNWVASVARAAIAKATTTGA